MTYRCKSTIRVYEIGAEDRVYVAISTSSHSGAVVRQLSGPEFAIEVIDTKTALDGTSPQRHTVQHLVIGIEAVSDPTKLGAFRQEGTSGQRRYAVTEYEIFGDNVLSGD